MEKFRFGKTNLMVSRVAFGGIPIMRLNTAEASALVSKSLDLGLNFIDTANGYADSEEKIGDAIKGRNRQDIIIATKSGAGDKKTFNEHLDLSLKRLGVDYIDIYQLHNAGSTGKDKVVLAEGGAMEGLEEAVKAGKVRFPAFSAHSIPIAMELMKTDRFAAVQIPFNYIDDLAAKEIIPLAKELDIGFIAMKPMGGGLLDDAGLAFRYLGQFDNVFPDPGIEKLEEISQIIDIVNRKEPFSVDDKKEVERQKKEFGPVWCHRCDYCQPCPQGIGINPILCAKSALKRMPLDRAKAFVEASMEKGRSCTECRECVSRCPYDLDIPNLIRTQIAFWDSLSA